MKSSVSCNFFGGISRDRGGTCWKLNVGFSVGASSSYSCQHREGATPSSLHHWLAEGPALSNQLWGAELPEGQPSWPVSGVGGPWREKTWKRRRAPRSAHEIACLPPSMSLVLCEKIWYFRGMVIEHFIFASFFLNFFFLREKNGRSRRLSLLFLFPVVSFCFLF